MFDDFRSCYRRLQFFDNLIDQITHKIGSGSQVTETEKIDMQNLLKELKGELKKDFEFMSNVSVQNTLSDIDKNLYLPAIQQALSRIKIKTGSMPDQKWVSQLYEVQTDIRDCMSKVAVYL